ncbi:MAG: hypothetical protein RLZZ241_729 [Bacteroidota bacterium]|jgi:copper homeostasis protein
MLVEVCANSPASALKAQEAGADRIEFCNELAVGGVTPSYGQLEWIRENIKIPVHVLIRPRSGDFCYSDAELECMIRDIKTCAEMGFAGIVSGSLHADRTLNLTATAQFIEAAGSCHFTFHRAFDRCVDPVKALKDLAELGVKTVLTSGQAPNAVSGLPILTKLLSLNTTCAIMPGGGVNPENAGMFQKLGFSAIHLSGISKETEPQINTGLPMNSPGLLQEGKPLISNPEIIRAVMQTVKH